MLGSLYFLTTLELDVEKDVVLSTKSTIEKDSKVYLALKGFSAGVLLKAENVILFRF